MIRKLRIKFIIIAISSLFLVLIVIIGAISLANYNRINNNADEILQILSANEGSFPMLDKKPPLDKPHNLAAETPYETRYFTALINEEGAILSINTRNVAAITASEAIEYIKRAWETGNTKGSDGAYRYLISNRGAETLIVFLDYSRDISSFKALLIISTIVSLIAIAAVFILVLIFSKIAVKPVAESYEKQKRFITDASHEIKTPLAIIEASTEVLEMNKGEDEWTVSIKNQVKRLSDLTSNLISLSRMDEGDYKIIKKEFSLSQVLEESVAAFVPLVKIQDKSLQLNIAENIKYSGDERLIRQLISILTDNALKHSSKKSVISISLDKKKKYIELQFSNQAEDISKGNLNILFERFYRVDSSRSSKKGGQGIGLAVAKTIVLSHKGKIKAESPDGKSVIITVCL